MGAVIVTAAQSPYVLDLFMFILSKNALKLAQTTLDESANSNKK